MNRKNLRAILATLGVLAIAIAVVFTSSAATRKASIIVSAPAINTQVEESLALEIIADDATPLAAPQAATPMELTVSYTIVRGDTVGTTTWPVAEEIVVIDPIVEEPAIEQPATEEPVTEEPIVEAPVAEEPIIEEPVTEEPATEEPIVEEPVTEEPETPATPAKAQKPSDTTDVTAMAKFLFDAGTEFWAVEKNFSGTTTRPVSTRVAPSIGSGTAVDCPGGDTVRVDKNGVEHDSYAIADHFREYVDMPDLQYFKLYLSEKDYTVDPYGAREDVTGAFYQSGSNKATYTPEE